MANVLLIDPPWYALQNIKGWKASYGLASIASILRKNGHKCVIYNGEFGPKIGVLAALSDKMLLICLAICVSKTFVGCS